MEEMTCILENDLVSERYLLRDELYNGKSMEILILLLSGEKTANEIARTLEIPPFSTRLFLSRLQKFNMIKVVDVINDDKTNEKVYALTTSKLDIVHVHDVASENDNKLECEKMANHFSNQTSHIIRNLHNHKDSPYVIKSSYINASKSKMIMFKEKLEALIQEFNDLEEENEKETYGFIANFAPQSYDSI